MRAAALLTMLIAHGYRLTLVGDALRLQGPRHALTEDMRQAIRQHKAALMALLTAQETPQVAAAAAWDLHSTEAFEAEIVEAESYGPNAMRMIDAALLARLGIPPHDTAPEGPDARGV